MFKVGETVRNVAAEVVGVVVETDGDVVYLEQSNGCEVEFVASALILESQFQAKHDTSVRDDAASRTHDVTYGAVLQNLYPAIVQLGQTLYAQTKRVPGIALKSWDALSDLQKLNAISEATETPVQAWIEANRPGAKPSISTLQLSVLAAKGQNPKG
jgi:hypothetical protein